MNLEDILSIAEQVEEMRWKAEAYNSIEGMLANKRMAVVPEVDHTRGVVGQIAQLIQRTVEWDNDKRQWQLLR